MTFPKALGGAAAAVAWLAAAPQAAALNFHFSFVNAMNGGGAVSGMIFGLSEGTGPAAGVWVTGNTAGFGFGDFVGAPRVNSWTVTDGQITDFDFMAFGSDNGPGEVRDAALMFGTFEFIPGQTNRAGLSSDPFSIISSRSGISTADMALTFVPETPGETQDFHFLFVNAMNGGGTVWGMVSGLEEGTGPAASVTVAGNTAGFGLGEFVGAPRINSWTVTDGRIADFDFMAFGSDNGPGEVRDAALTFGTFEFIPGQTNRAGLSSDPFSIISARTGVSTADMGLRFMPRATVAREAGPDDPAAVPAPPALAALGLGLLALAGLARRRSIASGSGRG